MVSARILVLYLYRFGFKWLHLANSSFADSPVAYLIEHDVVTLLVGGKIALGYDDSVGRDQLRHEPTNGCAGRQAVGPGQALRATGTDRSVVVTGF
jgi:hypothetical protein